MTRFKLYWLGAAVTAALAVNASAQEMPQSMPSDVYYQGSWGINGELFNFDPVEAYYDGVSDTGFGLGAGYAGEYGLFNFNIGIGAILVDDEDEFSQQVEYDWSGDRSTESSSISALTAMVDAGVQFPLTDSRRFLVGLNAGYRHLDMSREITNCSDCYSENIYISGDTYLKPFVKLAFNQRVNGSLALYQYSGDQGLEDSVQFQVNWEI